MTIDPYILALSALTVIVTIWMGFWSARQSKTASDFFVAGRSVSVGWNASAISGEYLSAASFMGVAGMVMSSGYDALWYPVCYACGYLFLLLFIAGPLRRFGAYTIPDFAEGRFDSPLFRKIAVIFVLFIGLFYTMPQMKGAGTTLAYVFPGLPYGAGVVLVGAVITLNVALGGMKGITLVQAFQYWAKMFAISVPIFVLMAVYGHYGKQVGMNRTSAPTAQVSPSIIDTNAASVRPASSLSATAAIQLLPDSLDPARTQNAVQRQPLPAKAPADDTWLNPFGPLTTKAAKAAAAVQTKTTTISVRPDLPPEHRITVNLDSLSVTQALLIYAEITGRQPWPRTNGVAERFDDLLGGRLSQLNIIKRPPEPDSGVRIHSDGSLRPIEVKEGVEDFFKTNGLALVPEGQRYFRVATVEQSAIGNRQSAIVQKEWLAQHEKPLALLYTYSLIIALVCGTAGLPHILVRFYTNPDGVAAKRTTMWVMILIGVFYLFPPVFGVLGRNLLPELYTKVGAKGTDKVVLELPRILNQQVGKWESEKVGESPASGSPAHSPTFSPADRPPGNRTTFPWGSLLSGVTCAGAFAAFMSTFSGLLVSMTGALAHDVYGRMLRPQATAAQRLRAFKICAVAIGGIAILLGLKVELLEINFMVGQAFAIAAASYFPLLFLSAWWRGMTMKGAATGMLAGGTLALTGISLTSFTDLKWLPLDLFWAAHPLLRILCEQPAIWAVPLAITLMVIVSKATQREVPADIRMKMLVLHAPEKLGLKHEYVQEHQREH